MESLSLGHCRVGHLAAERAHVYGEALSEAWVLRQLVKALYEHGQWMRPLGLPILWNPRQQKGRGHGRCGCHSVRGTGVHTVSNRHCFRRSTTSTRCCDPRRRRGAGRRSRKARQREEGKEWCGGCACSDSAPKPAPSFMRGRTPGTPPRARRPHRIGSQNDPLVDCNTHL